MVRHRIYVSLSIVFALESAFPAFSEHHFDRQVGKKLLDHTFSVTVTRSPISCSRKCSFNPVCLAINFCPSTGECQLCDETPEKFGTMVEDNNAWNLYHVKGPCDTGWIYWGTSCYWLETSIATWSDSAALCESLGAHLLEIADQPENDFVQAVIQSQSAVLTKNVWHGLNDLAVEQTFVWPSGVSVTFTNFGTNEGIYDVEDCVAINSVGTWGDLGCGRLEHSMCEIELV